MTRLGKGSNLRYIEITHVNHFGWSGPYDATHIPVACCEEQALNLTWSYLRQGAPLPPNRPPREAANAARQT